MMAYAYTTTLNQLKSRFAELEPIFKRKGVKVSKDNLDCPPPVEITM